MADPIHLRITPEDEARLRQCLGLVVTQAVAVHHQERKSRRWLRWFLLILIFVLLFSIIQTR